MAHKVTLIPGEGIGPEVASAVKRILAATGAKFEWEELEGRSEVGLEPSDERPALGGESRNVSREEGLRLGKQPRLREPEHGELHQGAEHHRTGHL